jgi:predicted RNA binding protein YcfA (HicA-like mRNA interferase family)
MADTVSFAALEQVLESLGFVSTRVPGSHVRYDHPSGAVLVLRDHDGAEPVGPGNLAVVRRTLVENGLIDRARLEELLRERSLAG